MKIDSIEDTLYFLAGLDVAHTSTVLSEGGTAGQAGLVVSPTLNNLDATNWTDNQWFNFVCGLIKVAAGQTPPTPFPEYIEGYNFAIIPPNTVYARGTANEIVWTGVDEVILQVGVSRKPYTLNYKTYLIDLAAYTLTELSNSAIQLPKAPLNEYGSGPSAIPNYWIAQIGLSRVGDYHYISGYIGGSTSDYQTLKVTAAASGKTSTQILSSIANQCRSAGIYKSLLIGTQGTSAPLTLDHLYMFMTDDNGDAIEGAANSWASFPKLTLNTLSKCLVIAGYAYEITDVVAAGNNIIVYTTINSEKRGYEFTDVDFTFGETFTSNIVALTGTFTGRVYDDADWIFVGTNRILAAKLTSSRISMFTPQTSGQQATLAYSVVTDSSDRVRQMDTADVLHNIVGIIPPDTVAYRGTAAEFVWTMPYEALLVIRSTNGDSTWRLNVITGTLTFVHDGAPSTDGSSLVWDVDTSLTQGGNTYSGFVVDCVNDGNDNYWSVCVRLSNMSQGGGETYEGISDCFVQYSGLSGSSEVFSNDGMLTPLSSGKGVGMIYTNGQIVVTQGTTIGRNAGCVAHVYNVSVNTITYAGRMTIPALMQTSGSSTIRHYVIGITQSDDTVLITAISADDGMTRAFEFGGVSVARSGSYYRISGTFTGKVYEDPTDGRIAFSEYHAPSIVKQFKYLNDRIAIWQSKFRGASYIVTPEDKTYQVNIVY